MIAFGTAEIQFGFGNKNYSHQERGIAPLPLRYFKSYADDAATIYFPKRLWNSSNDFIFPGTNGKL